MEGGSDGWDYWTPDEPDALAGHLDDVHAALTRHVAFPSPAAADAATLWAAHAHLLDAFESTPRLAALSAEKGSGKTRLLEVLELLVPAPVHTVNMSPAALFRLIDAERPTLLLDEADTYLGHRVAKDHEELRGLVNAGHRRGAPAYRCEVVGKKIDVRSYDPFAAVALAGIGDLPDTITDRSVIIPMKRRRADDLVLPLRHRMRADYEPIRDRLATWAAANIHTVAAYVPEMPPGIVDRPADVWEPLIVIGDLAGTVWSKRARAACIELNQVRSDRDTSLGIRLLGDLRAIYDERHADALHTVELLERLHATDSAPWADLRGKPLDARGLSRFLSRYDVKPATVRIGEKVAKGYQRVALHDAWVRYLPPPLDPAASVTAVTAVTGSAGPLPLDSEPF